MPDQQPEKPEATAPRSLVDDEPDMAAAPPPQRVRVAWIAGENTMERLGRTLQPLAIGLLDELVEIVLVCPQRSGVADLPIGPIELLRHGRLNRWGFKARSLEWLAKELANRRVDAIHALDAEAAWMAPRLCERMDVNYLVSSYSRDDGRRLGTLDEHASAVLAASEPIRAGLLEHHVAAVDKIHLVPPGVYQVRHTTLFDNPQQSTAIVACGDMDDFAAFDAVLRAFAEVAGRKYDCAFFLIGSGSREKALRLQAHKLGLDESLTFVDWQVPTQLAGILKAADIYISPLPLSGIDMQALLAMAAGDPVLAAAGGCSDFLIDGKTALLFRQGDSAELTLKLMSLLDDHARARSLAEDTLLYLHERHSPAIMVAAVANLYRQAARRVSAPAGAV